MDQTLIHSSYPMSYSLNNDFKYQNSERTYSNGHFTTNELVDRKHGLPGGAYGQHMTLGSSHGGLDYSATQLQHETQCNTNSHLILTPPQSGDESSSTITNPSSTSYSYSSLPKLSGSSGTRSDYYSTPASNFLPSAFNGASMTTIGRRDQLQMPSPLSPPYNYGPVNNNSFPPSYSMSRPLDVPYSGPRHDVVSFYRRPPLPQPPFPLPPNNVLSLPNSMTNPPSRPEGPPFEDTYIVHPLVTSRGQSLGVDILASIPKGFFKVDDKWTCYRRNYFSVSCGFTFKTHSLDSQVFLQRYSNSSAEPISGFAVSIAAKTAAANNTESEARGLVQHTPKRDKATESIPTRHTVMPTHPQGIVNSHGVSHPGLYPTSAQLSTCLQNGLESFGHGTTQSPQNNYTFERIQFQKATANNGKRRAQQQYFHVLVNLEVNIGRPGGHDEWIVVAHRQSHPMVVRGRSPGHYKDNRRDSQTSMDPDGGSGHGGDGHPPFSIHSLANNHASSMNSNHVAYRHNHHYGNSFSNSSHHAHESDSGTTSPISSTLASSPTKGNLSQVQCNMTRTTLSDTSFSRVMLSPLLSKVGTESMEFANSRKRPFEDDNSDGATTFFSASLDHNYHSPTFDFSTTSAPQTLCASS